MIQHPLQLGSELIIDLFAGGGGASTGIEAALGRAVDIAVNHDPDAIQQHEANHPDTLHLTEDVFRVDPVMVTGNQPVGLLHASPDCTHHSKAKGGKPVSSKRRGLAWVTIRWLRRVRPRVMTLENVEEFADWGPLVKKTDEAGNVVSFPDGKPQLVPCPVRKGEEFRKFVDQIRRQGYQVEWRILRACDFGAPTIRRRLYLVARRDGLPIVWPKPTHGDPDSREVKRGKLLPWRSAAECIDWSLPAPSIFTRRKPLAPKTLDRIAKGVVRFVLEAPEPFILTIDHQSSPNGVQDISQPLSTITAKARHCLVAAFLAKHYGGVTGIDIRQPTGTVTTVDHHALVAAHLLNLKGSDRRARAMDAPAPTICAGGTHAALVSALMAPYYGSGSGTTGRDLRDPAPTVTTKDRLQLVTVQINGETYVLEDIGMRMLQPRELYRAQGFPDTYIIDRGADGRPFSKEAQVRMCGNSVCPPVMEAIVRANFSHERRMETAA